MAHSLRTRFTPQEALYYLKARPQFSDLSERHLSEAIAAVMTDSEGNGVSLVNLAQLELALAGDSLSSY